MTLVLPDETVLDADEQRGRTSVLKVRGGNCERGWAGLGWMEEEGSLVGGVGWR
jgi:hypothetical protein